MADNDSTVKKTVKKTASKKKSVKKQAAKKKTVKKAALKKKATKKEAKSPPPKPITVTAYGRHRKNNGLKGGTHQAVKKAIDSARLKDCVIEVGDKKMITDAVEADLEWDSKTTPDTQTDQNDDQSELDLEHSETSKKYTSARARRLDAQADLAEIELQKARGLVLDLSIASKEITTIGKELIQGLTNISRTQAAPFAAEDNPQIIRVKLQELHKKLVKSAIIKMKKLIPNG